jgi:isoquinoline 1-oxidoreductase beta subunit
MEPLNCTIELTDKGADIWSGCQLQTVDQLAAAHELGFTLEPWKVKINTMLAGGSFGRRGAPAADLVVEACRAARAIGLPVPVHLVWTREDDIQGGYYRPMVMHHVKAGWTADGGISGWQHQLASKSIFTEATSLGALENKLIFDAYKNFDDSTVEGVEGTQYAIDNFEVRQHNVTTPAVPVTWWRSVGNSHTAFVMETMVDELAHRAEKDPVEFRLGLLKDPRDQAVLNLVREKSKWDTWQKAERRGHGIAFHYSFRTRVAMVAEVTLGEADNTVTVDRIVAAVDVGTAINPDIVRAQVEGAVGFALSMVLRNQITLRDGKVEQSNFDDYEPTRMREMPKVKVCIVDSKEDPSGIGEPGVPPVAPAIGNAIADARARLTGKRTYCYELPLGYATPLPKA